MLQVSVNHRRLVVLMAVVAMVVSVAWVSVASRASAASATPVVYVATGERFPDAMVAAGAAAVQGGPVLLVTKTSIPAETAAELTRLSPDVIYVAGGPVAISDAVFDALKAYAPTVKRAAGADRYSTAVEVSKATFPIVGGGDMAALEAQVAALTAEVDALKALLSGVSRDGNTLLFEGMNLQVVNGLDDTETSNGLGNVIVGYSKDLGNNETRNGSHYLIVGDEHSYDTYGGIVSGLSNTASGIWSSVCGGSYNTAGGLRSSVSGGNGNVAGGSWSSVSGGSYNTASGPGSSILGGKSKTVPGDHDTYP